MAKKKGSTSHHDTAAHPYAELLRDLEALQGELGEFEQLSETRLQALHAQHRAGALNMVHYLALRQRDIRPLQKRLAAAGLSSLGRLESHVLANINAIIDLLRCAMGERTPGELPGARGAADPDPLEANTNALFGKPPLNRRSRIMVTLPADAADDYALIKDLLDHGMDCARINCAHDTPEVWARMIDHIKHARRETGRHCRILMDLGGPKLRTGNIAPGPAVLKWRPHRDAFGKVVAPARIWLYPESDGPHALAPADACLPVQGDWLASAAAGDTVEFTDARGASRKLQLVDRAGSGFWAEAAHTAYLTPGLELRLLRPSAHGHARHLLRAGAVGALFPLAGAIRLQKGEQLTVTREPLPGQSAQYDRKGRLLTTAAISCSLPEVFSCAKPGERILIDDGRIGGVIRSVGKNKILVEITKAREGGEKLLANKGINLPDTRLDVHAVTPLDIEHLQFIVQHADMVGLSFARSADDVRLLQEQLQRLNARKFGVVLKVETRPGFENLPELLFALMHSPNVGVMIARGDLAVESGYERLAELQEEILWLTEAAHLPVIWATQVLEGLSKTGKPSRAEITDAAMGVRAECVMLNKGAHILAAMDTLDDLLHRMQSHQLKKSSLLRRLHWQPLFKVKAWQRGG
jgi:pyruvate kinase